MKYLSTGHAVYDLTYHIVIVTKYRRKVITKEIIEDIKTIVDNILVKNNSNLLELNGEEDHIYMIISLRPTIILTKIINSIKTISSRVIRKKYNLKSLKYNKKVLWSPSYFIQTCGNVKIEQLKSYIENQGNKFSPPKQSLEGA